jgi:hypothetical protein
LHFLGASGWLDGWAKPQSSHQAIQAGLIIDNFDIDKVYILGVFELVEQLGNFKAVSGHVNAGELIKLNRAVFVLLLSIFKVSVDVLLRVALSSVASPEPCLVLLRFELCV